MQASKTLTSAITAATILGAVSFVYAQTSSDSTAPATDQTQSQMAPSTETPSAMPGSSATVQPADTAATPSTDSSATAPAADSSTPAPKADRN
jgi:hypothetical protein